MDISQITDYLYIAAHPRSGEAEAVQALGVRLIISMIFIRPTRKFFRSPFRVLILPTFDSKYFPVPVFMLRMGVKKALPEIQAGRPVMVYCREGRHRSVAMASCILIGKGYSADEAMALVSAKREAADPYVPYIQRQIRKFEKSWNKGR